MKRILAIVFLLIIVFGAWWLFFKTDKSEEVSNPTNEVIVKKHSDSLNNSVDAALKSYFDLKGAFVEADTAAVKSSATHFLSSLDNLKLDELKNDSIPTLSGAQQFVGEIKSGTTNILIENNITKMRHEFSKISENLYPLLNTIGYEGQKVYWQNCPMAFGDQEANWLSNTSEIINPYLGKHHPEFKGSMLNCGEVKDSLYLHARK
jgi:hypothetical protein